MNDVDVKEFETNKKIATAITCSIFQKELVKYMLDRKKVHIHVNEYYSAVGVICEVGHDYLKINSSDPNYKNPLVVINFNKIVYIREMAK